MRGYWRDYVEHMLRVYCRHTMEDLTGGEIEQNNMRIMSNWFRTVDARTADLMMLVYSTKDAPVNTVRRWCSTHTVSTEAAWATINHQIKVIAKMRGLI